MMSRKLLLLASVGLASLQGMHAQFCSPECNTCCPRSSTPGDLLTPDANGDCISQATGKAVCALSTGRCLAGPTATTPCDPVLMPSFTISQGGVGPNAGRPLDSVDTFLAEGSPVWNELELTQLPGKIAQVHEVPPIYHEAIFKVPKKTKIEKDTVFTFRCVVGQPCNVVVFLYECYPCETEKGGLPAMLLQDGFERSRCAPAFTNGRTDTMHKMTGYVKSLEADTDYNFKAAADIEFALFGMTLAQTDCDSLDAAACGNTKGHCTWKGNRCKLATCVQMGPGGGCNTNTCIKKELA
eukprot:TRINITY_DN336_c0_g2_i2.p1 TRINITY_DN336_c0_g2~~TRINITY_DN336_c0_g2_i2.p1  ORF type:complete len:323 (+),score=109.13 TRINITY_DN336_c0_g2_i2:81-971(+)